MQQTRLTWMIGGGGLILCGVLELLRAVFPGLMPFTVASAFISLVYAASLILFAIGLSRFASVVDRRPVGIAALFVLALWPLLQQLLLGLLPAEFVPSQPSPGLTVWTVFTYASLFVPLIAAIVAVVEIARARTVPSPWRWVPAGVLAAVVVIHGLVQVLILSVGAQSVQAFAGVFGGMGLFAYLLETAGLGVAAVILAVRARPVTSTPAVVE